MDFRNLFRQVDYLYKHRHDHDGEDFQTQIQVIRTTIETQGDTVAASAAGAYIHLSTSGQSIVAGGEDVEWIQVDTLGRFEFEPPSFPTTTVTIPKSGYYNLAVPILEWESWTLGGEVSIWRNDTKVWPPLNDAGWSSTVKSVWRADAAHAVWFDAGDTFRLFVDHGDASAQTLAFAAISAYLVDRAGTPDWELVFPADNWGVTWDGTNWWTTLGDKDNVNPALFKRSATGAVLNSYNGYDTHATEKRNRGLVHHDSFLWGLGNNEVVSKIDPSNGTVTSTFAAGGGFSHQGIDTNGTNLFVVEIDNDVVLEYNTTGTLQNSHSFPTGRELRGLAWDGSHWWSTLIGSSSVIRMDANFSEVDSLVGPTASNRGCHHRGGFLYVMTPSGLYRRAV